MENGKLSTVDLCVGVTKGIWSALFENSTQDADLTEVMLDGTIVRLVMKKIVGQSKL